MSRTMLLHALLAASAFAVLHIGIALSSPDAMAALPMEECIQCDTNGCTNPPPGWLIGHKDTEGDNEDWRLDGELHSGCVYNEEGDTCDPHVPCDNGEEELLMAVVSALEEGDARTVKDALDRSKTLRFNSERMSIQGLDCEGVAVVRNVGVPYDIAEYLTASQN